jgi:hypothetical protein
MINLIKLLIVVIALTMTAESIAQEVVVNAGFNLSSQLIEKDNQTYYDGIGWKPGFIFGATTAIPITGVFSFEPGISLSTKGYKQSLAQGGPLDVTDVKRNVNLYCVDLPINVKALFDIGTTKIYGTLGPYIGIGLWGKEKSDYLFRGEPSSGNLDINWGSDAETDDYKRIDFGLNAGVGLEIKSVRIGLSYSYGLANISPNADGGLKINNRVITFSLGYKLGKK